MRSCSPLPFHRILPAALVLFATITSQAAPQRRIASIGTGRVPVPHTVPRRVLAAGSDLGDVAPGLRLDSLMIAFNRTDTQQAALDRLLINLQDPSSPRYHQWLTPEQFGEQFGLSSADLSQVSNWLTAQGFTITGAARSSNFITFSGTAAQVKQAFGASIHNVMVDGEAHISNLTDPALPAGIASVVTSISGLNDIKLKARARPRTVQLPPTDPTALHPNFTSSISGSHFVAPGDFYTIYNESPLFTASTPINGKGITVGVVGQTTISNADVTAFRTASGLGAYCYTTVASGQSIASATNSCSTQSLPTFATTLYGTSPGSSPNDLPEALLDVEWAGATAPGANILFVNSTNVLFTSMVQAIANNVAPILSISYGICENGLATSQQVQLNQSFQQANAQGQTIVGPSGDSGATDCDYNSYPAVDGLAVDFPASSPYVTAAGGSMFNEGNATGATTYWNSNSSSSTANAGSAIGYIPETVWNESSSAKGLSAGGGGFSLYFPKPYWQTGTGVPNDSARDVPDISLNSATAHDGTLYCVSNSCVTGFRGSDGQALSVVGGTSVAAPSFAGVLALVEQKTSARIGNAGPMLYALATVANVYHDITVGNNNSACTAGTNNCPSGGTIGYSAGVGYDLATGLGSVNVANLVNNWNTVTPAPPGTTIGTALSTTTVTTTSQTCGKANATLDLTIRVAAGSGSGVPTGSIQLLVDNVATGSPLTLTGGAVTTSLASGISANFPSGIASGFHTIIAVYSGNTTYAGSKGVITTDVVSATRPDFNFTAAGSNACVGSITAKAGATAAGVTLTVTPVNGFTGTVTFSATSDNSSLNATYTFTPTTLTFSSPTPATTNLVLNAFISSANPGTGLVRNSGPTARMKPLQTPLRAPWYVSASGAALGCALLLIAPRRRRWSALLAAVLSIAALTASGCGSTSTTPVTGGTGTITNAAPGTYDIQVIATSTTSTGTVSHLIDVLFTVN